MYIFNLFSERPFWYARRQYDVMILNGLRCEKILRPHFKGWPDRG